MACVIRLVFSPITALIGFYINSQKNDKKAVMYESDDKDAKYDEEDNDESEPAFKESLYLNILKNIQVFLRMKITKL